MRDERTVDGCLLTPANTKLMDSKGPVLTCGVCPNRSDDIGDLGQRCAMRPAKKVKVE